jgi:hypothetical protein
MAEVSLSLSVQQFSILVATMVRAFSILGKLLECNSIIESCLFQLPTFSSSLQSSGLAHSYMWPSSSVLSLSFARLSRDIR